MAVERILLDELSGEGELASGLEVEALPADVDLGLFLKRSASNKVVVALLDFRN